MFTTSSWRSQRTADSDGGFSAPDPSAPPSSGKLLVVNSMPIRFTHNLALVGVCVKRIGMQGSSETSYAERNPMKIHNTTPALPALPKLSKWAAGWEKPVNWMDYLQVNIHPEDMLIISKMWFPDFVEVDNSIFLEWSFTEESYKEWKSRLRTKREIELLFNHIHLWDVFSAIHYKDKSNIYEIIALQLRMSWEFSLKKCFPCREFEVLCSNTDQDYGPTITFCEQ